MGLIQRTFAWGIAQVMRVYEPLIRERKRALFRGLHGNVLEIGPGTGPNLKYFPMEISWHGVDPNPFMEKFLRREADRVGLSLDFRLGTAERLPYPDQSFDFVVGTLVLCSVPDPEAAVREIQRVLKPGGSYLFIEHVRATPNTFDSFMQRFMKPLWRCCADGCEVDRETENLLRRSEFAQLEVERFRLRFPIIAPHIMGWASMLASPEPTEEAERVAALSVVP